MTFEIFFSEEAQVSLMKMDAKLSGAIISWIERNLDGAEDPSRAGKARTGDAEGLWKYRVGDFRFLSKIEDQKLIILTFEVRRRRTAYR